MLQVVFRTYTVLQIADTYVSQSHLRACHPLTAQTMTCSRHNRHRLNHRRHPISTTWPLLVSAFSRSSSSICTRSIKQANMQLHHNLDARTSLARYPRQPLPCVVCGRRARAGQSTTTRKGLKAFCQNAPLVSGSGFRVQGSGFRVQGSGFRVQGCLLPHWTTVCVT